MTEIGKRGPSRIGQGKPTDHVAGLTKSQPVLQVSSGKYRFVYFSDCLDFCFSHFKSDF